MKLPTLIVCLIFLLACNTGVDKKTDSNRADTTTETTTSDTAASFTGVDTSTEFIRTFSTDLKPWLMQTTKSKDSNLSKFAYADNWVEDSLIVSTQDLEGDFLKTYQSMLVYSPDKKKVIDLGSYGTVVTKNKKGQSKVTSGEPDTEVAVIDLDSKKRRRIFFSGPGTSIDHGFWMNDSTVVLAGKTGEQQADVPVLFVITLRKNSNFVRRYEYTIR